MELTTPTGAAILTTVAEAFGPLPAMTIETIGLGAGTKDLKGPGQPPPAVRRRRRHAPRPSDRVWVLETNLDDLPGEVVGHATTLLMAAGALDAFLTPIQMKKNRPGVMVTVLCDRSQIPAMETILFRETTTLGIRRYEVGRHKLKRQAAEVATPFGPVQGKLGWLDGRPPTFSPEYEDCARVAREQGVPLRDVYNAAHAAYAQATPVVPATPSAPAKPEHGHDHGHSHDHGPGHTHGSLDRPIAQGRGPAMSSPLTTFLFAILGTGLVAVSVACVVLWRRVRALARPDRSVPVGLGRRGGEGPPADHGTARSADPERPARAGIEAPARGRPAARRARPGRSPGDRGAAGAGRGVGVRGRRRRSGPSRGRRRRSDRGGVGDLGRVDPDLGAGPGRDAFAEPGRRRLSWTGRFGGVWGMADAGMPAEAIARETGQPIGQVELILGLRRQLLAAEAGPDA